MDFTAHGVGANGSPLFESNPGGAPANVLTSVTRQGGNAAFIGKVGDDMFGHSLAQTLNDNRVNTQGLLFDREVRTTLAFVDLDREGNRNFSFFRNPGADYMLETSEIRLDLLRQGSIFHFGSLSLTDEPARSATLYAINAAKSNGALISYDPNLRPALWKSFESAKTHITARLADVDILKISEGEFSFITGESDFMAHAPKLAEQFEIPCIFITLGAKGAMCCYEGRCHMMPTYMVPVVDTTGSGDAFMGAVLYQISQRNSGIKNISDEEIGQILKYANASGSLAACKKGGIPSMPTKEEILACMETG